MDGITNAVVDADLSYLVGTKKNRRKSARNLNSPGTQICNTPSINSIQKTKTLLLFVLIVFTTALIAAHGEDQPPALSEITTAEFEGYMRDGNSPPPWKTSEILSSGRLDIIKEYLGSSEKRVGALRPLVEMPESSYKDSITLILLRLDDSDGSEVEVQPFARRLGFPLLDMGSSYRSIILRTFPGLPLRDGLVSTNAARSLLADSIEQVIAHPEKREEFQHRLEEFASTVGGKNLTAPLRTVSELKLIMGELIEKNNANNSYLGTGRFDEILSKQLSLRLQQLEYEQKASVWVATHAKPSELALNPLRPASAADPATLPININSIEGQKNSGASSLPNWHLWGILTAVILICSVLMWWIPRQKGYRDHEI